MCMYIYIYVYIFVQIRTIDRGVEIPHEGAFCGKEVVTSSGACHAHNNVLSWRGGEEKGRCME